MNLLQSPPSIPIGSLVVAGGMDSNWLVCDGSIYNQSSYPKFCASGFDIHPYRWGTFDVLKSGIGSLAKAGNVLVALPYASADVYYSTDNGDTWQTASNVLPSSGNWSKCISNGSRFVAFKYGTSAAAYSDNGTSWTGFTLPASSNWAWCGWNGTVFGLLGARATAQYLYYSAAGDSFSAGAQFTVGIAPNTYCYGDGSIFIFRGSDFKMYRTVNGTSFDVSADIAIFDPYYNGATDASAFIWLNGNWYAGNEGDRSFSIWRSSDGVYNNWTKIDFFLKEDFYADSPSIHSGSFYADGDYVWANENSQLVFWVSREEGLYHHTSPRTNQFSSYGDSCFYISKSQGTIILGKNYSINGYVLLRQKFTDYDYTTQFQVPNLRINMMGAYYYIKVK
jgi:hypothetical protein